MLLRFHATNFLSIDTPLEFSMLASKESQHPGRLAEARNVPARVLQVAAIWGGNAAGKSNLCRVLDFAQRMVVTGTRPDASTGRIPFRLRENAAKEASRLIFEILVDVDGEEKLFRYLFSVTGREVVEESLVELRPASERFYFKRSAGKDGSAHAFSLDWWEKRVVSEDDRLFAHFVAKGTKANQLFLHEAMDRNLTLLAPVFRWFRDQLVVLEPGAPYLSLEIEDSNRQDLRDYTTDLLSRAGTGISGVDAVEVPLASLGMPPKVQENLTAEIREENEGILLRSPRGERFSVFRKDGELMACRIVTYRASAEGKKVAFETRDESDGTLRLLDLAPVLHDLDRPGRRRVYVIDELDRSMHSQLTEALLEHYLSTRNKDTRSQLIFTTHDLLLMNQRLLRRDEMWLIERGRNGETLLESLSDYKNLRNDKDVRKAYIEGRFSGVPHLKPFGRRSGQLARSAVDESARGTDLPATIPRASNKS